MAVFSDLDMEFTRATDGDIKKDSDVYAIVNSLNNIVSTMQGSRRMLPEFAQDIWNLLFDPIDEDTARLIGSRILEAIQVWEDRVEVRRVNIDPDYDANQYNISVDFRIKKLDEVKTIDFILYSQ